MKKWIVRFVSLLVYNVAVLLLIGALTSARVGWAALWAGIVLTALMLWVKPLVTRWFRSMAAKSAHQRTKTGELVVQGLLTFGVALVVWVATVLFSRVSVGGFWGWVLPPILLLIGWSVYAAVDERIEAQTSALYDRAEAGIRNRRSTSPTDTAPASTPSPDTRAARAELHDGLTAEQRRMLDEL
ncbi:hypothetical protein [Microbacterium sp.]|uniref:hypothetical protein n=1 Tax=Microbacterium sp. TaxID=51671 RepID=UPI0039E3606E